ncbi:FHA domain-containing protein [Candidatus Uabimicrobium amorphum]|uniref:nitric oxide dioxygenase n=1 Tax=Uabimicrobium amorphum TaxID=2596890 RepID=A0A5S9IRY7_UABAM|nr:FHA domain-containing protein [Candidatus Uabimicrobium amorphum]BBM86440.1 flavohemoprotein [Candidatus Uabimicrobium amorphum]
MGFILETGIVEQIIEHSGAVGAIIGLAIVALVTIQLTVYFLGSLKRSANELKQHNLEMEVLKTKLQTAKIKQYQQETATLGWNGFRKFVVKKKQHEGKQKPKGPYLTRTDENKEFHMNRDEMVVGRTKDTDIQVVHNTVSGKHARILCRRNELFVVDDFSTNGTTLNSEKLKPEVQVKLNHGDDLVFGDVPFKVSLPAGEAKEGTGSGICSFYLSPHDGRPLPSFEPGQYLTFQFKVPGETKPAVRCYSLSDSPKLDYYRVSIKRHFRKDKSPGLISHYWHDHVQEGDIIDVKAPGGKFYLDMDKQTPIVLIAGGVGITPCLSMLNTILDRKSKRETWFFYGLRNGKEHVFKEYLESVALENDHVRLHVCYSRPNDEDVKGKDYQHAERVSVDLFKRLLPSNNYDYYMCGPGPMMKSVVEGLDDWGVPEKNVHYEAFGPASVKKAKPAPAPAAGAPATKVTFAKSDQTVDWTGGTILELGEAAGISMESGCRAGNCGACVIALKSGEVNYVSEPSDPPEAGTCYACIAEPKGDIAVDA